MSEVEIKEIEVPDDEEVFGLRLEERPAYTGKRRKRKAKEDTFSEIKIKMVMRIYCVSRARAIEIIAGREAEKAALEAAKDEARGRESSDDRLMSAEEFFGEVG